MAPLPAAMSAALLAGGSTVVVSAVVGSAGVATNGRRSNEWSGNVTASFTCFSRDAGWPSLVVVYTVRGGGTHVVERAKKRKRVRVSFGVASVSKGGWV